MGWENREDSDAEWGADWFAQPYITCYRWRKPGRGNLSQNTAPGVSTEEHSLCDLALQYVRIAVFQGSAPRGTKPSRSWQLPPRKKCRRYGWRRKRPASLIWKKRIFHPWASRAPIPSCRKCLFPTGPTCRSKRWRHWPWTAPIRWCWYIPSGSVSASPTEINCKNQQGVKNFWIGAAFWTRKRGGKRPF